MSKKPVESHTGKRSWWDGSLRTDCGGKIPAKEHRSVGMFEKHNYCPGCAAGRKHKH